MNQEAAHWDRMAGNFKNFVIPDVYNDRLYEFLTKKKMLKSCQTALDIGCGAGRYSIALARDGLQVCGIDISPKMIDYAKANAAVNHVEAHTVFTVSSWNEDELKRKGIDEAYDLVVAHMTPAINTPEAFKRMMDKVERFGVLTMHTRRQDTVFDQLEEMVFGKNIFNQRDEKFLTFFKMLWQEGYEPEIFYEPKDWTDKRCFDEAVIFYLSRLRTRYAIDLEEEKTIRDYLEKIEKNGCIEERITSTAVTLCWQNKGANQ